TRRAGGVTRLLAVLGVPAVRQARWYEHLANLPGPAELCRICGHARRQGKAHIAAAAEGGVRKTLDAVRTHTLRSSEVIGLVPGVDLWRRVVPGEVFGARPGRGLELGGIRRATLLEISHGSVEAR